MNLKKSKSNDKFLLLCLSSTLLALVTSYIGIYSSIKIGKLLTTQEQIKVDNDVEQAKYSKYTAFLKKDQKVLENIGIALSEINKKIYIKYETDNFHTNSYSPYKNQIVMVLDFIEKDKEFLSIVNFDEEKLFSFIYYHEFAHSLQIEQADKHLSILTDDIFKNRKINIDKVSLYNSEILYKEIFADIFALHMMSKRYPELDMEKTSNLLSGLRSLQVENHYTSFGLFNLSVDKNIKFKELVELSIKQADFGIRLYNDRYFYASNCNCGEIKDYPHIIDKIQSSREDFKKNYIKKTNIN